MLRLSLMLFTEVTFQPCARRKRAEQVESSAESGWYTYDAIMSLPYICT